MSGFECEECGMHFTECDCDKGDDMLRMHLDILNYIVEESAWNLADHDKVFLLLNTAMIMSQIYGIPETDFKLMCRAFSDAYEGPLVDQYAERILRLKKPRPRRK